MAVGKVQHVGDGEPTAQIGLPLAVSIPMTHPVRSTKPCDFSTSCDRDPRCACVPCIHSSTVNPVGLRSCSGVCGIVMRLDDVPKPRPTSPAGNDTGLTIAPLKPSALSFALPSPLYQLMTFDGAAVQTRSPSRVIVASRPV